MLNYLQTSNNSLLLHTMKEVCSIIINGLMERGRHGKVKVIKNKKRKLLQGVVDTGDSSTLPYFPKLEKLSES